MLSYFLEKLKLIKLLFKTNKFCLITIMKNNDVKMRTSVSNNSEHNMENLITYLYCVSLAIFKKLDGNMNYDDKIEALAFISSLIEGNIGRQDDDMQVLQAILKQFKIIMDLEND